MRSDFLIKRMENAKDLPLPGYMTELCAGMDLYAAVERPVTIAPGERALIPTGVAIALPSGYEAQIRPRSGLALEYGVTLVNSPGTIDADYRGEIKIILINHGAHRFTVERAARVAQMIIAKIQKPIFAETDALPRTKRGDGGFGHTGIG
ncbi:MAG: dUTP diphosphatase [Clostridiales bacterium]|jgi:dUTP pyrophosphatase|nr:dUTP diphosphatase [Clostridiales bacterium]